MKKFLIGILVVFLITSCNNNEVNSNDKNWQAIATVENPTLSNKKNSNQELQLIASKVYCFRQKKVVKYHFS